MGSLGVHPPTPPSRSPLASPPYSKRSPGVIVLFTGKGANRLDIASPSQCVEKIADILVSLIEKNHTITPPIPHGWSGGSPLSWIWTRDYSTTRATRVLPCGRQNIHPSQRGDREPEKENRRILIPKLEWEREIRRLGHGFRWGPLGVGPSDVAAGDRPARGWAWSEPAEIDSNRLRRTREPLLGTPRGLTQRGIGDGHLVFAVPGSAIIHVPFTVVYGALLTTCCTHPRPAKICQARHLGGN